ncbi:PREDICTED: suppressor APC domain-containing protein 2 [Nanorana parkeri]|uniref:suppressor APC domain-containing protein 2 n=1 Tax=Nanorana parkeri TaxID=125878 RepID=UPI000854322B|nr:PREDICTED: suppressor APC domain-containing protein 2 [Nanorana parkeri]
MEAASSTQGLPRAFLHSLRTLFDILDDERRGYVHIHEIETRWRGADTRELPPGVLHCLRKVAPPDGFLTFDRFVLGLRTSMFNSQNRENCHMGAPRAPVKVPGKVGYPCKPQPLGVRFINGTNPGRSNGSDGPACRGDVDRPRLGEEAKNMCRSNSESTSQAMMEPCRHQRTRGEHRRHTITNGVDYGMLKRMKELEHEKDLLLQGLEMVEKARDWYLQQIHTVQEQQMNLGKKEYFNDAQPGPSNQLLTRLQEVNRCLSDLLSPCRTGVHASPVTNAAPVPGQQQTVNMLKEQNRLLTKEVCDKSDRITKLEQEKSALIKQLFEARARNNPETSAMDSTFI